MFICIPLSRFFIILPNYYKQKVVDYLLFEKTTRKENLLFYNNSRDCENTTSAINTFKVFCKEYISLAYHKRLLLLQERHFLHKSRCVPSSISPPLAFSTAWFPHASYLYSTTTFPVLSSIAQIFPCLSFLYT